MPRPGFADLTHRQMCTSMNDGGHQAHDHTPSRGVYASSYVPRHQNNDVVLPVPPQGLLCQDSTNASNSYTLQSMVAFPTAIHKCDTVIDVTDLRQFNDRSLLFDIRKVTQRPLHNATDSGAVPDPATTIQGFLRAPTQDPLQATSSSGAVPVNDLSHAASFRGWGQAIYVGGHPAWGRCEIIHMAPNPPFAERCAAATQDNGWLASDEALWFLRLLQTWRSDITIGPLIQWSPSRDLQHLMAAEDQLQCNNGYLNILLFLVEAHWCAVEVDRRTEPVHVVLIQWPQEHHTLVILEVSRILQIPTNRMLVTIDTTHEVITMCGWTILFRWYTNFAMQTCLQPLIHATDQTQAQIDSVLNRAQRHWNRTNAPSCLRNFAVECRRAFMSAYARDQPDTRLPNVVSTVMFVGPQEEYVQEVNQVPRPPTHREREINWLRTMLIQPAWLTNFEVELVLQMTRMQILDRFLPGPLHFDPVTGQLEPFVNDLPSVAGYTKVLFFLTLNYHWISISGTQHQNRWMLTAVVPDPRSRDMPPLFDAIATLLETSPDRVHIQAIPMQSPPHLCGWLLLYSLQEHCQASILHDATMLLQRIAVMPNSRIKTLIFEEALSTWTRHAPHQSLVTFATQIRSYFLAHMDTWSSHHVLRFGGMFPQSTPVPKPASWTAISQATKAKILTKIRSHVQRPYICPCVDRLTAFVEVDRLVEVNDTIASFIAYIKPSPLQWASQFCQENVLHEPCSHNKITEVVLQVPSRSADVITPHVEAIIYRGRVQFLRSQVVVQVHDLESGIRIFRTGRNHPTTNLDVGELCSGAFSGWTQATKILSTMGYPIQTKFAIDHDHCVATWYARNYTDSAIAAQPEDVFRLRDECFYYREAPITLQTDVSLGWFWLFCEPVDIVTASPPCPAFSNASTAAGLEKPEGQVIIDTILKILLLQPKIMVLEEVASLRSHVHFPLILELLNWGNFQVAWQEVLNLDDWLPQSRPRLILIAFRRCSYGLKHFACKPWNPRPSRSLSLHESHCLLADEAIIEITSAPLDLATAKLYFEPTKIPGATPRSFKDVLRFRLRTPNDRVQCIMASYAFGHEIDADSQSQRGIFGSLLRHQGRLRFLAGPELLWLQGLSVEWQGPLNPRLLNHIIGNAISVPHALIGLFNVLGHFTHLEFDSFPHDLFLTAMASRLHAQNSDCIIDIHTGTFAITPKMVPATAPWDMSYLDSPPLTKVIFLQGNKHRTLFVQSGLSILPVFAFLFSTYDAEQINWLPFDRPDLAIPVVETDTFWGVQMVFTIPESFRLCLQEQSFSTTADKWTVVLMPDRTIVQQVQESETIATLSRALAQDCPRPFHLCNHMLTKLDATAKPRQVTVARFVEPPVTHLDDTLDGTFLDMGEWLQATMNSSEAALFLQTCHASGVTDLLESVGWQIFELQQSHPQSSRRQLTIIPNSARLFVDAIAIRNLVAAHVTTWYVPLSVPSTTNTIMLSLKLWDTVIWKGHLPLTTKTDVFANAWHSASSLLGPLVPVRSILRGKRLSPEENFAGYVSQEDRESPLNRVHLVGVLTGGGNKTDLALRTNQSLTDFLLQSGASSITTPQFVKEVLTLAGVSRIQQILAMRDAEAKLEQVKHTALHFNISLPEFVDLEADLTKRVRRAATKHLYEAPTHKATDFTLPADLFHDTSGTPISIQSDCTQPHGVFLVDACDAKTFVDSHQSPQQSCIMVVLGQSCPMHNKACHLHNLPATDKHGTKVVIAACVHYIGETKATLRGQDQADISTESTSVLAFTAWRSETGDVLWSQLCESPLRTIWKLFTIDPTKNVVTKPWGRSWRTDNTAVEPDQALSFQVHVRLYTSKTSAILAQSGTYGIFVNPKTADGTVIDPAFAVIWLRDKDRTQALEEANKVPEHAGLVISTRGKQSYGIRVPSSVYEEAQALLTPEHPKQSHIPANCFVKLSPLPHGVTQDDIRTWLEKQALRMRPVRSLTANTWLLAASDHVEACHYIWGKSTVLIAPVASRAPSKPTVRYEAAVLTTSLCTC